MFFSRSKSKLGIDIGTSSIKVAQIKKEDETFFLETYGMVKNVNQKLGNKENLDAIAETAEVIKELLEKSRVTVKKAVASLPNNIVFVTLIEMPKMSSKQLKEAVEWEAKRYVPLPLEEVTLSWSVLEEAVSENEKQKVLLTAVPTSVIDNYLKMFKLAGLDPEALEIEALALIRSLVGPVKKGFIIVDVGSRSSTLNLVDQGILRVSRNISVGGESVTNAIAQSLNISYRRAENFKRDLGLTKELTQHIPQAMKPVVDRIKSETGQLINIYESGGGKVEEIIFAGNGSLLPGLLDYFKDLGGKTTIGDPLKFISYSPQVKDHLQSNSLAFSVAIGLAMRT